MSDVLEYLFSTITAHVRYIHIHAVEFVHYHTSRIICPRLRGHIYLMSSVEYIIRYIFNDNDNDNDNVYLI